MANNRVRTDAGQVRNLCRRRKSHGMVLARRAKELQQFKMPLFGRSDSSAPEPRQAGQFGAYYLQELINSGGMADIWLATDSLGKACALRLLHHSLRFNSSAKRRFLRGC